MLPRRNLMLLQRAIRLASGLLERSMLHCRKRLTSLEMLATCLRSMISGKEKKLTGLMKSRSQISAMKKLLRPSKPSRCTNWAKKAAMHPHVLCAFVCFTVRAIILYVLSLLVAPAGPMQEVRQCQSNSHCVGTPAEDRGCAVSGKPRLLHAVGRVGCFGWTTGRLALHMPS